jgi:hypothetical protein
MILRERVITSSDTRAIKRLFNLVLPATTYACLCPDFPTLFTLAAFYLTLQRLLGTVH